MELPLEIQIQYRRWKISKNQWKRAWIIKYIQDEEMLQAIKPIENR